MKRYFWGAVLAVLIMFLAGCATCGKKDTEIQSLRNQIQVLQTDNQVKDNEITNLREAFAREMQERDKAMGGEVSEIKERPTVKQVQAALKNAGYNPGSIDGKMGKQTRDAIRAFQRANGLSIDGRIGKLTWGLLKEYLNKKAK